VIICDIHMPVVSGEQVARMIRSTNNHNQNTPSTSQGTGRFSWYCADLQSLPPPAMSNPTLSRKKAPYSLQSLTSQSPKPHWSKPSPSSASSCLHPAGMSLPPNDRTPDHQFNHSGQFPVYNFRYICTISSHRSACSSS
jgi:hypothetical protein